MHASNNEVKEKITLRKLLYFFYIFIITCSILEIGVRVLTKKNPVGVDLFLNLNYRYLLPLPSDSTSFYRDRSKKNKKGSYRTFDDTLGWSHKPWGYENADFLCYANDKGMRITQMQYNEKEMAKTHYDILHIGGSYTHSDFVACKDSWPFLTGKSLNRTIGNLGVGGYAIDQAILRLIFSGLTADTVILDGTFGSIDRVFDPVYTFYQGGNKTKPIIQFSDTIANYINLPVLTPFEFYQTKSSHTDTIYNYIEGFNKNVFSKSFWTKSYFLRLIISTYHIRNNRLSYPRFLANDPNFKYSVQLFYFFKIYCIQNNMHPIVLLLDQKNNIENSTSENPWSKLKNELESMGIDVIDFHDEIKFEVETSGLQMFNDGIDKLHYSESGNKLIAKLLANKLR